MWNIKKYLDRDKWTLIFRQMCRERSRTVQVSAIPQLAPNIYWKDKRCRCSLFFHCYHWSKEATISSTMQCEVLTWSSRRCGWCTLLSFPSHDTSVSEASHLCLTSISTEAEFNMPYLSVYLRTVFYVWVLKIFVYLDLNMRLSHHLSQKEKNICGMPG